MDLIECISYFFKCLRECFLNFVEKVNKKRKLDENC